MYPNRLRQMWAENRATLGAWLAIPDSFSAEMMAHVGFDWLTIDMQHGIVGYQRAVGMLQAISTTDTVPLVRVPRNEPAMIGKALDAGAQGVVVPLVNSRAETEAAVRACLYPPEGARSWGPTRAALLAGRSYLEQANRETLCIVMIETAEAVAAVDDIASVPGVDALFIGPADLSLALGLAPAPVHDEPEFVEALDAVLDSCGRHGVVPGIAGGAKTAPGRVEQGFLFVEVSRDAGAMMRQATVDLRAVRDKVADDRGDGRAS